MINDEISILGWSNPLSGINFINIIYEFIYIYIYIHTFKI